MGFGTQQQNNSKLYILKIKTEENKVPVAPHFEVLERNPDESAEQKWIVTRKETNVSGDLTKVETEKKNNPKTGQEYDIIKLTLTDSTSNEVFLFDFRFNLLTRSLFNALVNLDSFENVKISIYESKKGDKTYPAIALRQNEILIKWKYALTDLPAVEEIKDKKGEVVKRDYDDLNAFFLKELGEISEKVKAAPKTEKSVESDSGEQNSSPVPPEDDDIPF